MTNGKLNTSLSANTIMAKLTNYVQQTRHITPSTDKHYSLDSEDDFRSGCRNVSHQQQFFSELLSPGRHTIRNTKRQLTAPYFICVCSFWSCANENQPLCRTLQQALKNAQYILTLMDGLMKIYFFFNKTFTFDRLVV